MDHAEAIAARLAAGHNGILTTQALLAAGLSPWQAKRLLAAGSLERVRQGVHRHAAVAPDRLAVLSAAAAIAPGAVASHRSASELHRLDVPITPRPEVTVPGSALPRFREARVHRTDTL